MASVSIHRNQPMFDDKSYCNNLGAENKLPVGNMKVSLQVIPKLEAPISKETLTTQMDVENSKSTERERLFLIYAKQWWKEFLEIREEHRTRLVKIFGQVRCLE